MRPAVACLVLFLAGVVVACGDDVQTVEIERPEQPEITPEQDQTEPRETAVAIGATRGPDDDELARRAALFKSMENPGLGAVEACDAQIPPEVAAPPVVRHKSTVGRWCGDSSELVRVAPRAFVNNDPGLSDCKIAEYQVPGGPIRVK